MLAFSAAASTLRTGNHEIALDARGDLGFVSHAHADHVAGVKSAKRLIASDATFDLLAARNYAKPDVHKKRFRPDDITLRLANAGHILGSSQLYVENGSSFTYTGDFKLRDSLTQKGAEVVPADTLAIECTYGLPRFLFPDHFQVCEQVAGWVSKEMAQGRSVVLGGYSLGKAQEIIKILNDYLHLAPLVDSSVYKLCEIYDRHGVPLQVVPENSEDGKKALQHSFVAVYPFRHVNRELASQLSFIHGRKVSCGLATGWSLIGRTADADASFCLSDHADFNELVAYVERASPKRVICMHGYNAPFAKELKRRGYNAFAAGEAAQQPAQSLLEFD